MSYETVVNFIRTTCTKHRLTCYAYLDTADYPTGVKITPEQQKLINLVSDRALPKWNYTIKPRVGHQKCTSYFWTATMWTLRRYQPADREAVRQLAGDTAHFGDPIERFLDAREVFLDAFASFYTDVMSNYLWIAEEDGALLGYIMGCPDTFDYNEWFRANVRSVAWRAATLRYRGVFTRKSMGYIWRYAHVHIPYVDLSPYPAHLHINTRAELRGSGIGTALMNTYLDQLRNENIPGVHLETSSENVIAVPWYERLGFQLLQRTPSDLYITSVGHSLDFLLYGMKL